MPKKAVTTSHPTGDRQTTHATLPTRSNDRTRQSGPKIPSKQKVLLAEITCHACGKKGHYCGSEECPKTLTLAPIHALGIESDQAEPETPEEPEEEVENPFEGKEFDGKADVEIATSDFDNNGIGAIVVGFHTISQDGEEESDTDIANIAALATTGKMESDKKIANELVSSIKEQYETRGSGYKAPFRGPSAKQLKESQQQTWASNSNSKPNVTKGPHPRIRVGRCLTAVLKVNGTDAFVCWDSGSELDAISPDFVRAAGIKTVAKESPIKVRLATKGSTSTTSYEVDVNIDLGNTTIDHPLEVLNLDRWDVILGRYFCRCYNVCLDYESNTIRIGEHTLKALSSDEEASTQKARHRAQQGPAKPKVSAVSAED